MEFLWRCYGPYRDGKEENPSYLSHETANGKTAKKPACLIGIGSEINHLSTLVDRKRRSSSLDNTFSNGRQMDERAKISPEKQDEAKQEKMSFSDDDDFDCYPTIKEKSRKVFSENNALLVANS